MTRKKFQYHHVESAVLFAPLDGRAHLAALSLRYSSNRMQTTRMSEVSGKRSLPDLGTATLNTHTRTARRTCITHTHSTHSAGRGHLSWQLLQPELTSTQQLKRERERERENSAMMVPPFLMRCVISFLLLVSTYASSQSSHG